MRRWRTLVSRQTEARQAAYKTSCGASVSSTCIATARDDIPKRTDLGEILKLNEAKKELYDRQERNSNGCDHHFQFRNLTVITSLCEARATTIICLICSFCARRATAPKGRETGSI